MEVETSRDKPLMVSSGIDGIDSMDTWRSRPENTDDAEGVPSRHPSGRRDIHPVFLRDRAHLLHRDTLDHLHVLCDDEWDSRVLLSLGLVRAIDRRDA
jgi:hypothetical protein